MLAGSSSLAPKPSCFGHLNVIVEGWPGCAHDAKPRFIHHVMLNSQSGVRKLQGLNPYRLKPHSVQSSRGIRAGLHRQRSLGVSGGTGGTPTVHKVDRRSGPLVDSDAPSSRLRAWPRVGRSFWGKYTERHAKGSRDLFRCLSGVEGSAFLVVSSVRGKGTT